MDKSTADKMAKLFFAMVTDDGVIADEDMPFFTNHLSSFTEMMNEQAVEALTLKGVDEDFAHFLVYSSAMLNKMYGAHSFNDFVTVSRMAEQMEQME